MLKVFEVEAAGHHVTHVCSFWMNTNEYYSTLLLACTHLEIYLPIASCHLTYTCYFVYLDPCTCCLLLLLFCCGIYGGKCCQWKCKWYSFLCSWKFLTSPFVSCLFWIKCFSNKLGIFLYSKYCNFHRYQMSYILREIKNNVLTLWLILVRIDNCVR